MSKQGYKGVSLPERLYDELASIGIAITKPHGIKPLTVPETIAYLKNKYQEGSDDEVTETAS